MPTAADEGEHENNRQATSKKQDRVRMSPHKSCHPGLSNARLRQRRPCMHAIVTQAAPLVHRAVATKTASPRRRWSSRRQTIGSRSRRLRCNTPSRPGSGMSRSLRAPSAGRRRSTGVASPTRQQGPGGHSERRITRARPRHPQRRDGRRTGRPAAWQGAAATVRDVP